uniref:SLX4 interacting protein n=1 Tax=Hypotaenidia okinawae TaxID=2861861 RepID=A0A6G1RZQ0_9GRUI
MASNKFVIKCGNFAVLVDVHISPQGSNKDTSWFSDHEKEEVCMLLEEVVASRVKHYLEAPRRGQWKPMEPSGPLFLTAKSFHITAYFMKRWVNLRCAVGKHYRELRVFPDRFIVCVSKFDCDLEAWAREDGVLKEEVSSATSEYFTGAAENKKLKISLHEQIKQDILKKIVKRKKTKKNSTSKPQISKDSKKVCLGSVDSQRGNRKNDRRTSLSPQSEGKCRSTGQLKDCINTAESSLELPVLELENYVNRSQPDDVSSQQKPPAAEWVKSSLLSENLPWSSESAPQSPKENPKVTKTQAQQETCGSEENLEHLTKASSEGTALIPGSSEMSKRDNGCLGLFLEEKTPLNSVLFTKQDMLKTLSDENLLTLRTRLSRPLSVRNNIMRANQNEPSDTAEELPAMPPACPELQPVSSEKLTQKRKKEVENGLRKLKLRRLKKS